MSAPKLIYFDIRGFAELPRLVLTAAGQKFEDDRIHFEIKPDGTMDMGTWPERKETMPYKQVPVLVTEDGTQLAQSNSIVRYIARKYGLDGETLEQSALVDAAHEQMLDVKKGFFSNKGNEEKLKAYWAEGLAKSLLALENNVAGPYVLGDRLTYADVSIYYQLWVLETENKEGVAAALAQTPKVKAIFESVPQVESIKNYLAQRKVTNM